MTTINNSNIFSNLNECVRRFPTIPLQELTDMKGRVMNTGNQRRFLNFQQKKENTKEFFRNATFTPVEPNARTQAFEILSDKDRSAKRLEKTKMCRNILQTGVCNRSFCTFAHTLEELSDPECAFGETCRRKSFCKFKHPDETRTDYHTRCGIVIPTILPSPVEKYEEQVNELPTSPSLVVEKKTSEETVIRIPQELAAEAILKAIECGIKNIRIEIV